MVIILAVLPEVAVIAPWRNRSKQEANWGASENLDGTAVKFKSPSNVDALAQINHHNHSEGWLPQNRHQEHPQ